MGQCYFIGRRPLPPYHLIGARPDCVPALCLVVIGSDNKFSAGLVLKRWQYIVSECNKYGITVTSFGADGDSRELKAMQVSTGLL